MSKGGQFDRALIVDRARRPSYKALTEALDAEFTARELADILDALTFSQMDGLAVSDMTDAIQEVIDRR